MMTKTSSAGTRSSIVKRSIIIGGHKTSVSLEDDFWNALKEIAGGRETTLSDVVSTIDAERPHGNLSSAIRLYVLAHYRTQIMSDRLVPARIRARAARHDRLALEPH
jgi:predicted DNA-binding ribbon-helix-helix protein